MVPRLIALDERTPLLFVWTIPVLRLEIVTFPEPFNGERTMLPVVPPPMVKVLLFVVWILEAPAWKVRLLETLAVPLTSNSAVGVLVPMPT